MNTKTSISFPILTEKHGKDYSPQFHVVGLQHRGISPVSNSHTGMGHRWFMFQTSSSELVPVAAESVTLGSLSSHWSSENISLSFYLDERVPTYHQMFIMSSFVITETVRDRMARPDGKLPCQSDFLNSSGHCVYHTGR